MKKPRLALQTLRLRCFKAVRDSGIVRFTPLTAFIGNNGSGKSSLIEALEALQTMVLQGLDEAMAPWRGFDHVWNKAVTHRPAEDDVGRVFLRNPLSFSVTGTLGEVPFGGELEVSTDPGGNTVFVTRQDSTLPRPDTGPGKEDRFRVLAPGWREFVQGWQFLNLTPQAMLYPQLQRQSRGEIRLARDGANLAQFLLSIHDEDPLVLEGIADSLQAVLPYATDLRPGITRELGRNVYLQLHESGLEEPLVGWLLSQGTLRTVALLAVLRHPRPPTVVFIEELENGLDPRTIHLIVEELRSFTLAGGQVVATTHS
ncbi:MAG: AAA family ATPase, partial [Desulfuromonadales bacterium]|nr:AAA family ATPase [Desulfuromonadales bacterium]